MVNMNHTDEESLLEKHDRKESTQPAAAASFSTASLETTPLWIHPKQTNESAMSAPYNPAHSRRRTTTRLPRWSWAGLIAVLLTICYLYGFSEVELPGSDYVEAFRSKHSKRLRIGKLPNQFLPQTGKHRDSGRLILVGDVHGMKKELKALLAKVEFDSKLDHLILTGDMIDKGPDSAGVIDLAIKLGASCVMGNHEHKAILENTHEFQQLGKKRGKWLKRCPHILRVGKLGKMGEVEVVHAGLMPGKRLRAQSPKHVLNMRTIDKHGKPSSRKEGVEWFKRWNQYQKTIPQEDRSTVVYGHNSGLGLQDHAYTKGLDTGCVNGGTLTALVIDGGEKRHTSKFVDVDCKYGRQ